MDPRGYRKLKKQMSIGQLIQSLESLDRNTLVSLIEKPHRHKGYLYEIGFHIKDNVKINPRILAKELKKLINTSLPDFPYIETLDEIDETSKVYIYPCYYLTKVDIDGCYILEIDD